MARPKLTVTIQDIAQAAGVSVSTVSRVINNKDDVAQATYQRVQQVIDDLGYTSSLAAKSMRSHQTNVIGLVTHDVKSSYNIQIMRGANRAIEELGYDLLICTGKHEAGDRQAAWERHQVSRLNGSLTDGIIVATPAPTTFPVAFPLVAVDAHSQDTDFPVVMATNRIGALAVVTYLVGLGHRRIGYIGGHLYLQSGIRRLQGYKDGLTQANIPLDPHLIKAGDFTYKTGFARAFELFRLSRPPTAIFAANDASAIGVIDAAGEAGLSVPDDLSVVGFDNIPEAAHVKPALTTVDQFVETLGYVATEMLVKLIQDKPLLDKIQKIPTKLIIRDSCRAV